MENKFELDGVTYYADDYADDVAPATLTPAEIAQKADEIAAVMASDEMAKRIVRELDDKLAKGIKLLHVEDQTILADYFVIASGSTNTQVRALCGHVEDKLRQSGVEPLHTEGYGDGSWILMDYAGVIVHLFTPETRQFYNLEKLWAASTEIDISGLLAD